MLLALGSSFLSFAVQSAPVRSTLSQCFTSTPQQSPKKRVAEKQKSPCQNPIYAPFFLIRTYKKGKENYFGLCLFTVSHLQESFFLPREIPFLGRSPILPPNVIRFQAFWILMRNDWVLIAQRVKCRSLHQYRASSQPQEISLPKSKTTQLPSRECEGEGLWLVITDEQIIKSPSLLILLLFKIKKVQPKHFQVYPSEEETLRRHMIPCLS